MAKFKQNYGQEGSILPIIAIIILVLALMGVSLLALNLSSSRQNYKDNADKIANTAVQAALGKQKVQLQEQFAEQSKSPYLTFNGPSTYGSISFSYPKTWDGYVDQTGTSNPINGFFYNGIVPPQQAGVNFPLRINLLDADYTTTVTSLTQDLSSGDLKASAYVPPKMAGKPNVQTGTRLDGQIEQDSAGNPVQGSMVVMKVRDKTLEIYTESPNYLNDFNNTILATLTFVP